ncbi:MAG: hypothetical protein K5660_00110 [Paludibacteraceae bacterium]|nr:hypothetical protein [Paludibacteraceae bacterium]
MQNNYTFADKFSSRMPICYLPGLDSPEDVRNSFMRGALFDNMVEADMMNNSYNTGRGTQPFCLRLVKNHPCTE